MPGMKEEIVKVILLVFGAGLSTGFMVFIAAYGISSALKIFKDV